MASLATLPTEILEMIVARSDAKSCAAMTAVSSDMHGAFRDAIPDKIRELADEEFAPVLRFLTDVAWFMARRQAEVSVKTEYSFPGDQWTYHELGVDEHDAATASLIAHLAESPRPEFGEWRIATDDFPDDKIPARIQNFGRTTTLSTEWNGIAFEMEVDSFRHRARILSMRFGGLRVGQFQRLVEGEPATLEEFAFRAAYLIVRKEARKVWNN